MMPCTVSCTVLCWQKISRLNRSQTYIAIVAIAILDGDTKRLLSKAKSTRRTKWFWKRPEWLVKNGPCKLTMVSRVRQLFVQYYIEWLWLWPQRGWEYSHFAVSHLIGRWTLSRNFLRRLGISSYQWCNLCSFGGSDACFQHRFGHCVVLSDLIVEAGSPPSVVELGL